MDAKDFVRIAETGIPFIVDEAYVEYAGLGMSQVGLTKKYKNVLVTRTLSKAYGLAGLRFGYAMGDKDVIGQISAALIPWNVGTIPMWAALAALEDTEALAYRVKFNNSEVDYITEALSEIPGLVVFPSKANYILFDCGRDRQEGQGYGGLCRGEGSDLPPGKRKIWQRRLVPHHHRHKGREPHGRRGGARVLDQEIIRSSPKDSHGL